MFRQTRFRLVWLLPALAGTLGLAILCPPASPADPDAAAHVTFAWRLFLTGDTRGYLKPCGCATGLRGGLPRRATFLNKERRDGDLLIDLGNLVVGSRPHERLKLNYQIEGLQKLRYDALVPGEGELLLGEDFERVALKLKRPTVICANLVLADSGKRVYEPWLIHETPSGKKVAIVGLTSPYQRVDGRYRVLPLLEAATKACAALAGKTDAIVLAGYFEGQPALELGKQVHGIALVAASRVPRASPAVLRRGGAPVMLGGDRGQHVAWVGFGKSLEVCDSGLAWLGEDVPDDPALAAFVKKHDAEASELGEAFARARLLEFRNAGWIGSSQCRDCHQQEYQAWAESKHAHAIDSLRLEGQDKNPNCMECHLQDVASEERAGSIGCEACHGSGGSHAEYRSHRPAGVPLATLRTDAATSCVRCHDAVNSPGFTFATHWPRVAHGMKDR